MIVNQPIERYHANCSMCNETCASDSLKLNLTDSGLLCNSCWGSQLGALCNNRPALSSQFKIAPMPIHPRALDEEQPATYENNVATTAQSLHSLLLIIMVFHPNPLIRLHAVALLSNLG